LKKVLVIDDQEFKMEDIVSQLNKKKIMVDSACNLYSSKQQIDNNSYDLILLDMTITDALSINEFVGIDVLSYLEETGSKAPVIMVTQFYNFRDFSASEQNNGFCLINNRFNKDIEYEFSTNIDIHFLPNLHEYLCQNFKNYFGCTLYVQNDPMWIDNLKEMLFKLGGKQYEDFIIR